MIALRDQPQIDPCKQNLRSSQPKDAARRQVKRERCERQGRSDRGAQFCHRQCARDDWWHGW
eukprot:2152354-Prymnesium_polylepis.1